MKRWTAACVVLAIAVVVGTEAVGRQSTASLAAAIDQLVSFDFRTRVEAARNVRRMPAAEVVPALARAARDHKDGYVRYKALVLLAGYGDASASATMRALLDDRNDRVRAVTYGWFEQFPDPGLAARLVAATEHESSEFVRPALMRALAALHREPGVRATLQPLIMRGEDYFRGAVIDALGDHRASWAVPDIIAVAKLEGPLQDDAISALGKIGDRSAIGVLAELQAAGGREIQPAISAATCLITRECAGHEEYLRKSLAYAAGTPEQQGFLRGAAFSLAVLASRGNTTACEALLTVAETSADPARETLGLAVGTMAMKNPDVLFATLQSRTGALQPALEILRDGFDMLNEDLAEERFFVSVRKAFWAASEGSRERAVAQALIDFLEF
jgi:HEAT repeat protein